jgi:tripartite-type tricarboxylate transporter receptor subunit TctC
VAQQIKAGKLRALAHWGDRPLASMPEVPSLTQLGHPVKFAQWSGLFVPAATPDDVVTQLRAAAARAAVDPMVIQVIETAGSPIACLDAADFQTYWDADARTMKTAVQSIGKVE